MDTPGQTPDPTIQDGCVQAVTALFPDICLAYLSTVAAPLFYNSDAVINYIVDLIEKGDTYTRRPRAQILKRKREDDDEGDEDEEDEELTDARRKYCNTPREEEEHTTPEITLMRQLITGDFPLVRSRNVQKLLTQNGLALLPTYLALAEIVRQGDQAAEPLEKKKSPTVQEWFYRREYIDDTIEDCEDGFEKDILKELRAARLIRASLNLKWSKQIKMEADKRREYEEAEARGELMECQCCFADFPKGRLVECDGEACHRFCVECARRNAETLVGDSKYEMTCMSTDGCDAGFSHAQKAKFLDKKLVTALDRIEQEAVLRLAAIENLASCPFCPYAAEYPSVEVNREFQCENPSCQLISCRLCQAETHLPKTCEEAAIERGVSARRDVEEAMTAAMIRKCNKCNTPFIKESGCNKMRCTRRGCGNIQCYVCSKSCDYSHFNDPARGGQNGNCPLFEITENRHLEEVKNAEAEAMKRVAEKNPGVDPELLVIKMSDNVKEDDAKRRQNDPFVNQRALYINGRRIPEVENANAGARRRDFIPLEEFRQLQLQPNDHENLQLPDGIFVDANVLEDRAAAVHAAAEGRAGQVAQDPAEFAQLGNELEQAMRQAEQEHLQHMNQRMIAQQRMEYIQAAAQRAVNRQPGQPGQARQQENNRQPRQNGQARQQENNPKPGPLRPHGPLTREELRQRNIQQHVEIQRQRDLEQRQNHEQRQVRRAAKRRPENQQQVQREEQMRQQAEQELQRLQAEQQMQRLREMQQMQQIQQMQELQKLQKLQQKQQKQQQEQQQRQQEQALQQQQYELLRQQQQLLQQRQQEYFRQLQAGIIKPDWHQMIVGIPGGAVQDKQPQAAQGLPNNFNQGWLERLQGMDLGFGPMQGMDFGRTFSNGRGLIGQMLGEIPGPHPPQQENRNQRRAAAARRELDPDHDEFEVLFGGNRRAPFGAQQGAMGQR